VSSGVPKVNGRFEGINQRFGHMNEMCRTELRRFEEALVLRLKRLEER
jgi:hypothetical protein